MFFIPGFMISLLTFPGVIVHELAHQIFCRLCGVAVLEVKYFQMKEPAGYVLHEIPDKFYQNVLISIGPFIVNSFLGAIIAFPAAIPVLKFDAGVGGMDFVLNYFLLWIGISIAMHSFPSTGDAQSIWDSIKRKENPLLLKILITPLIGLIYIGSFGSFVWLDLFYGIGVAMFIPNMFIKIFV